MYDKFGQVLRVETVINNPREFKVRRWRMRHGHRQRVLVPHEQGLANLYQYRAAAHAANRRYLEALSVVNDPTPAYQTSCCFGPPKVQDERSFAGFNPARREDIQFFRAVLRGEHELRGFRNADLRRLLHQDDSNPLERRRQQDALGRRLKRLHVRGLVAKIPHTAAGKSPPSDTAPSAPASTLLPRPCHRA